MWYGRRLLVGIDALASILAIPLERRCRTVVDFWLELMPSLAFWRSLRKGFLGIVVDFWLELMLSFAFWMASYCRRFLIGFDALACIIDVLEFFFENGVLE